jgi:ABC-type bacteriocin/lantibiotic exporter with double-glycine peptidase domain
MKSLIQHLSRDKKTALMLLISSLIIGICALTPALFVIIVLNKYLASGITATLISLTAGAILALGFEFTFRQNRSIMMREFNQKIYNPLLKAFTEKFKQAEHTEEEYKKLHGAGKIVQNMRTSSVTSWVLDWPFVLAFLVVLIFINWTAAVITAIFMIILNRVITWKTNLNSVEILITGLLTLTIISIGAIMIMQGRLDVGSLIGSNILAARALQGTNKYTKAKEFIQQRDRAVSEIIKFIK